MASEIPIGDGEGLCETASLWRLLTGRLAPRFRHRSYSTTSEEPPLQMSTATGTSPWRSAGGCPTSRGSTAKSKHYLSTMLAWIWCCCRRRFTMRGIRSWSSGKRHALSQTAAEFWCSTSLPHGQNWVKERLGDRWLGFERAKLDGMMSAAGLVDVVVRTAIDPAPFDVIVAVGTKPLRAVLQPAQRSPSSRWRSPGRR